TARKEAWDRAVARIAELDQETIDLNAAIENHNNAERELRERITEIRKRLEDAEQAQLKAEIEADLRAKHETDRLAELTALKAKAEATAQQRTGQIAALEGEIEKLRGAEQEQLQKISEVETRLS